MHSYHDVHGSFPPSVVRGSDGTALHSWRVLILPFIEENDLYAAIRLNEPWDSPYNIALLGRMPMLFAAPTEQIDVRVEPNCTFYQVVVGPGAGFEENTPITTSDFPDGLSNTILVAEAAEAVLWMKPVDLTYVPGQPLPALGGIFRGNLRFSLLGENIPDGFHIGFADGSVRFVDRGVGKIVSQAHITRSGNEEIQSEW